MLYPLKSRPIFKPRIWGGRRLERLFGKPLPDGQAIGESWELSGLPGDESIVSNGPLAGRTLTDLVEQFGSDLLGSAGLFDGQFPLLIKLLDAREPSSVQVHPGRRIVDRPGATARLKNECWYVVDAAPGARIWIGLNDGVDRARFAAAASAGRPSQVEPLLHVQAVRPGDFFYLPAGTVHALGAGLVVAEVQTPSDTTYRVFDWDRVDAATGKPRPLQVAEALEAIDYGPPPRQAERVQINGAARLLACRDFVVDYRRLPAGAQLALGGTAQMTVWQILSGSGRIECNPASAPVDFIAGDMVLLPAAIGPGRVRSQIGCQLLEVTIPSHG